MTAKVVLLESAERDLKDLRKYLVGEFSGAIWDATAKQIKHTLRHPKQYPAAGNSLDVLDDTTFSRFRQVVSGMNRIIYEVRGETIFVYAILDTRRSFSELLRARARRTQNP